MNSVATTDSQHAGQFGVPKFWIFILVRFVFEDDKAWLPKNIFETNVTASGICCHLAVDCRRSQNLISSERQPMDYESCRQRPYFVEYTRSHPNSEVKRRKARSVLGWGTAREALRVLLAFFLWLNVYVSDGYDTLGPPMAAARIKQLVV